MSSSDPSSVKSSAAPNAHRDRAGLTLTEPATMEISPLAPSLLEEIEAIPEPELSEHKMANENFDIDLLVIGAGPGGYHAAIRGAQLGLKTVCVEKEYLGGTCLNWGCIPSKVLIGSAERLHHVKEAQKFGVTLPQGDVGFDFATAMARKDKIVQTQRGGIGMLFKKNGVRHVEGFAKFLDPHTVEVEKDGQKETLRAKNVVLAMGSSVIHLPVPGLEGGAENNVWTSNEAVNMPFVPKRTVILGGGAVGSEFAYILSSFGSEVTLVEMAPNLIPLMDLDLGVELGKLLGRKGIKVKTNSTIAQAERSGEGWKITIQSGDKTEVVECDVVLLGVGRKANVEGMNLENVGIQLHKRGVSKLDNTMRTHVPHIYAIGDVTGHIQLAHMAQHEALVAVHNIAHNDTKQVDYKAIPNVVYTVPEVASVGLTEAQAKEQGHDVVVGRARFMIFGKAQAIEERDGFVKVVAEKKYGEVLGVHLIGAHVTDIVHEAVVALKHEATLESMIECIHAHPTLSEAVMEALEDAVGHAIHKM